MMKYIYQCPDPFEDIIVSDSKTVSRAGYGIFMEIDISDFQSVIERMNKNPYRLKKIEIQNDGSCNISANNFYREFFICLLNREYSEISFEIKIHQNDKVVVYSRSIIDK